MSGGTEEEPDPIPGLELLTPRLRRALIAGGVVVLAAALVVALVPRDLAAGETVVDGAWQVRATAGLLTPSFHLEIDGDDLEVDGARTPGMLTATAAVLSSETTVVVGSVPPGTDSVRLRFGDRPDREATIRRIGWQRVHVAVLRGEMPITEAVAIGDRGEVLEVVDDLPPPEPLPRR